MPTVSQIAKLAFDGVARGIPDAIHAATLTRTTQGAYDVATGTYATTTAAQTGRAVVDTVRPVADVFPAYVVGPGDELILLEGFTSAKENDSLTFAGRTRIVRQVQDIVAAGALFYVIAR
ncbi:hypothetical protein K7H20_13785 [Salipiger manganoxidans]|uniref:hypothetical protein n=1 Tax=Salipiger marinus TaxID=555512 RepID=UPI001E48233B|nr:hypothetical protein [Salipiger manganoxidans]MCD1619136.1 hypothetical protein [Salipiger manganoxidans]